LGIDHERLVFRHQGRDYRLTDVAGKLVKGLVQVKDSKKVSMMAVMILKDLV
jgi:hypothetical protein